MKYFIDTNVFLSVMAHEDPESLEQGKEFFSRIKKGGIDGVTGDVVLAEITWVLGSYYKFPKTRVVSLLNNIKNTPNIIVCNDYDSITAIDLYSRTNVKFVDCLIASIPQVAAKEWTVISYDEDFKKLPVKWQKPGETRNAVLKALSKN